MRLRSYLIMTNTLRPYGFALHAGIHIALPLLVYVHVIVDAIQ